MLCDTELQKDSFYKQHYKSHILNLAEDRIVDFLIHHRQSLHKLVDNWPYFGRILAGYGKLLQDVNNWYA